jgi:5'-methylthioadenosine phosphorylase
MKAEIGIIGGSGFYSLLEECESVEMETDYGRPSAEIAIGRVGGRDVAFIPRHGKGHTIPPHRVPYRANIAALAELGVKRIIATSTVGSLKEEYAPGDFVIFDQFVNMTHGREDTFYDRSIVAHVGMAEPYCSEMRSIASELLSSMRIKHHDRGTAVVINGPRFSSKAESRFFASQGFETINMTQYPEAALAREKALCYLGMGIVTDYDAGLEGRSDVRAVTIGEVLRVFGENVGKAKKVISEIVPKISAERRKCSCAKALDGAIVTH